MLNRRTLATGALVLSAFGASACFNTAETKPIAAVKPTVPTGAPAPALGAPLFPLNFDPSIFDKSSATVTNPWWPLKPGNQWIWEGSALDGEEVVNRKLVFTVTDLVKEVAGVQTLVAWDRDYNNGRLIEAELVFFAQDKSGNIWHFGQSVEKYDEEGALDGAQTWLVGYLKGAKAGVMIQGNPKVGASYSEGYAPPPFFWDDVAKVTKMGQKDCVKTGCYTDVMVIQESEPGKPNAWQLKYYAKGVGNTRTDWGGKAEPEKEELQLVKMHVLTPAALAEARREALGIEARQRVHGITVPLQPRSAK